MRILIFTSVAALTLAGALLLRAAPPDLSALAKIGPAGDDRKCDCPCNSCNAAAQLGDGCHGVTTPCNPCPFPQGLRQCHFGDCTPTDTNLYKTVCTNTPISPCETLGYQCGSATPGTCTYGVSALPDPTCPNGWRYTCGSDACITATGHDIPCNVAFCAIIP